MRRSNWLFVLFANGCAGHHSDVTPPTPESTVVSLTFDDTLADQAQVGAMVAARQMRATFYVNSPRLAREHSMTVEQALELQTQGNEIAGHTLTHLHLTTLDSDAVRREVCDDRAALLNLGFDVSTFAYPYGDESAGVRRIVELCGYNAARDSNGLVIGSRCVGCPYANPIPPPEPYQVKGLGPVLDTTTLEDLEGYIMQVEANGGGWVPIVFHHVCDGCNDNGISPATLSAFIDWLADRRATGTVVKTASEVIGGPIQAAVAGPPPLASNMIQNPSLELDANSDAVPDCWYRRGNGTNEASYTLVPGAFDGAVAQQISVTSYTSGARRLMTRPECAPPVQPGHTYRITSWYIADTPPRYALYYRNTAGTWASFAQSPVLPTSATYVQGSYTTPPMPSDATAISVGMSISASGSITMDAFTASDAATTASDPPPSVVVTSPSDGASVSSTVMLTASASSASGIDHVDFRVNDRLENWADSEPFEIGWDTANLQPGSYVITARAFDRAGNVSTSTPITITLAAP